MNNRHTKLFNDGWKFKLLPNNSLYDQVCDTDFINDVEIPHDWLIYDTNDLYKSGDGWYKKTFEIEKTTGKLFFIEFDGVYMDSTVYVNGFEAGTWHNGYASFSYDITDLLKSGENIIMVQVRHKAPNSRWYSGAGIFRNVYLTETDSVHIVSNGVYISADADSGNLSVTVESEGNADSVRHTVIDADGIECASFEGESYTMQSFCKWSIDTPYLYTLRTELIKDGEIKDSVENTFGFRKIVFDPNEGFFLNGEYMKLKGVCLHHDLGALGAAVNYCATERQIMIMKEMGANAVRTSHNMPSRELLDICDRVGMLVDCESFDMWELSKTEYDNARFFKETAHSDVKSWVTRDRNHPCVIMWSIGNEIYDTHVSEHGYEIAEMLRNYVREFDPRENAAVTIASNYIEWENSQKIGKMLGLSGYNYTEKCYDLHHKLYPDTVIYGSETSSAVRSRGIYHFPADVSMLTHDDHQCSSLENCVVSWGRKAEDAWIKDRDRKFCAGQFIWTGIDYIGEPTPYSTKNSYFGAVDTAGIPKDAFYFYKSVWTDVKKSPMIHLLPYWDFNKGQVIDVIAYTNAPAAELFLNGKSLGVQKIDHAHGEVVHAAWKVPYEEGTLLINALDENGAVIASDVQKSFGDPVSVRIIADRTEIAADGKDLCFLDISVTDKNGTPVANARNRIKLEVSGSGRLLGMDNGDSTDYEQYKTDSRKLFSGRLTAIISSDGTEGDIIIKASSLGLEAANAVIKSAGNCFASVLVEQISAAQPSDDIPVRKIEAETNGVISLDENNTTAFVRCRMLPENATFNDVTFKIVKSNSVETNMAEAEYSDGMLKITAKGDGDCIVRLYANNGAEYPQVISDISVNITGLGDTTRNPYSMISGCTYTVSSVPLNIISNGALGSFAEPCSFGYTSVDFGKAGTEMIRVYIGNCCNREIPITVYDGDPEKNGRAVMTIMFPHNNGWGSFEPMEFALPECLKGVHDIYFSLKDNCIFGGFEFIPIEKAYAVLFAADNDSIYGDEFTVNGNCVEKIGNNVILEFSGMDFTSGTVKLEVTGRTPNAVNTIQLRYTENGEAKTQLLEFELAEDYTTRAFDISKISGKTDISFMFMPGSKFDFKSFRFIK